MSSSESFFTIGSCFAEYIRNSLKQKISGKCFPDYEKIHFDTKNQIIDRLNSNIYHMNHYSPLSIFQELNRSISNDQSYLPLEISDIDIVDGKKLLKSGSVIYQDPFRREVYSKSKESIISLSNKINSCVKEGIMNSNVFIITLGLVEIFMNKETGKVLNQFPGYMGKDKFYCHNDFEFRRMDYVDIKKTLNDIILLIKKINKKNKIVFSVSPIPLQRTFSEDDIFIANIYSKSVLRSAVESVRDSNSDIYYFPAYEIAMNLGSDFFQDRDLRHAKKNHVDILMDIFLNSFDKA